MTKILQTLRLDTVSRTVKNKMEKAEGVMNAGMRESDV